MFCGLGGGEFDVRARGHRDDFKIPRERFDYAESLAANGACRAEDGNFSSHFSIADAASAFVPLASLPAPTITKSATSASHGRTGKHDSRALFGS